jgi:hypothetical protein
MPSAHKYKAHFIISLLANGILPSLTDSALASFPAEQPELGLLAPPLLRHFLEDDDLPVAQEVSVLTFALRVAEAWSSSTSGDEGQHADKSFASLLQYVRVHRVPFKDAWGLLAQHAPLRADATYQARLKAIMKDALASTGPFTPAPPPAPVATIAPAAAAVATAATIAEAVRKVFRLTLYSVLTLLTQLVLLRHSCLYCTEYITTLFHFTDFNCRRQR